MDPTQFPGSFHKYHPVNQYLKAFEHRPRGSDNNTNILFFIGGLSDMIGSVGYVPWLLNFPGWKVVEIEITSSGFGWGVSSVEKDAEEISACIDYFHNKDETGKAKFVLMGHSTGSQDTFQYITNLKFRRLDGAILQAPISDYEARKLKVPESELYESVEWAKRQINLGNSEEIVPMKFRKDESPPIVPICARRWVSLYAGPDMHGVPQGDEDFFSSYITKKHRDEIWGKIPVGTRLMILMSGNDSGVSESTNLDELVEKWKRSIKATVDENSGVIRGATHTIVKNHTPEIKADFIGRVLSFLKQVESAEPVQQTPDYEEAKRQKPAEGLESRSSSAD